MTITLEQIRDRLAGKFGLGEEEIDDTRRKPAPNPAMHARQRKRAIAIVWECTDKDCERTHQSGPTAREVDCQCGQPMRAMDLLYPEPDWRSP